MADRPPRRRTAETVASSIREMQSQRTLPPGERTDSARWPMPNLGVVPMPVRSGSSSRT
jgi:hypothetical protein